MSSKMSIGWYYVLLVIFALLISAMEARPQTEEPNAEEWEEGEAEIASDKEKRQIPVYGVLSGSSDNKTPLDVNELGRPYEFEYAVLDHPVHRAHSRKEVSNGNIVKGEYRVRMPDGRTQIVRYQADPENGYTAEVLYEGEADPNFVATSTQAPEKEGEKAALQTVVINDPSTPPTEDPIAALNQIVKEMTSTSSKSGSKSQKDESVKASSGESLKKRYKYTTRIIPVTARPKKAHRPRTHSSYYPTRSNYPSHPYAAPGFQHFPHQQPHRRLPREVGHIVQETRQQYTPPVAPSKKQPASRRNHIQPNPERLLFSGFMPIHASKVWGPESPKKQ